MQRRTASSSIANGKFPQHSAGNSSTRGIGRRESSKSHILLVCFVLLLVASGVVFMKQRDQISQDEVSLQILTDKLTQMEAAYKMEKVKTDMISAKVSTLGEEKKKAALRGDQKEKEKDDEENIRKEIQNRLDVMKGEIQRHSKHDVLEQFGEGPYQIKFTLDFPPEEGKEDEEDTGPNTFVVEMAPLDLMPHSVHHFLEMVSHGLLVGTSFHRNANHVIQAGPTPYYKTEGKNLRKGFTDNRLTSVAFQEYSPEFPHVKYTLGFAGRPGGPDWYVSTVDNTKNHGPGGQSSYALASEADPCFGKVISGFDAIDRVHKMPVKPGWYNALEQNVGFANVELLKKDA